MFVVFGDFLIAGVSKTGNIGDIGCLAETLDKAANVADALELDIQSSLLPLDPGESREEVKMHKLGRFFELFVDY